MEDSLILTQLWERDEHALGALADKYGKRLYRLAQNLLGSVRDAQECVSDTFFALWNAIPPARPDSLAAYICRVCRNTALKRLRHDTAAARSCGYTLSLDELSEAIPGGDMDAALDVRMLGSSIDRFLETQDAESRTLFLRRYWFGDSVRDIARTAGLRENTVSVRLHRTRERLRAHLIEEGFYDEA